MTTFATFQNILPDPNNTIGAAGQVAGNAGPGFASVQLTSTQPVIRDSTNSGQLLARAIAAHKWSVNITYNPMVRSDFENIYSFIISKRGALTPFYVSLPQHRVPQDSTFAAWTDTVNLDASGALLAGTTSALLGKTGYSNTTNKTPLPGDLFNIDGVNSNHTKTYMVTRVETTSDYQSGQPQPASNQVRIHFVPGLQKGVASADDFVFHNPLIKVVAKDVQQYSLKTDNLYQFSLSLEEVQ
jgi:hypothetical protein